MHVEQFMSDVADMAKRGDRAVFDLLPKLQAHMAPADYEERKAIIEDLLARAETTEQGEMSKDDIDWKTPVKDGGRTGRETMPADKPCKEPDDVRWRRGVHPAIKSGRD